MASVAGTGDARALAPAPDRRAGIRTRARIVDRVMSGIMWAIAILVVGVLAYIIIYTIQAGIGVINWNFLTTADIHGIAIGPEVFNTFYIIIFALLICIPIGVAAAIYLSEYARQGVLTTIVRFATETLAGIPSLIIGLFGFLIFVTQFGNGTRFGYSRLAGALTLVILNLPLMLRVAEDAVRSVPNDLREASYAVGANKFQTVWKVLLPTALPGLTTGVILTAGKMLGETAALIFTAGGSSSINGWFSLNPLTSGDTLTIHLFNLQSEGTQLNADQLAAGTAAVLIILLLVFNLGLRYAAGLLGTRFAGRRS
jgi:phosphate transport system permease protein